jgi:predicted RNA binding protein YcfA (HicA-like mRNA interferase family)
MCRLLEANGWRLQRIKGSHHIYSKPGERKIISIPPELCALAGVRLRAGA